MELLEFLKETEQGRYLITFFVSMLPVVELRGAIPIGASLDLNHFYNMVVCILGNMVPVPFIILFIRRIFEWLKVKSHKIGNLVTRLENKAEGKWEKVHKYEFWGLLLLVAIPLPGTGAWTGALVAAVINMRLRRAIPSIFLGVIIAGLVVAGITYGFARIFA